MSQQRSLRNAHQIRYEIDFVTTTHSWNKTQLQGGTRIAPPASHGTTKTGGRVTQRWPGQLSPLAGHLGTRAKITIFKNATYPDHGFQFANCWSLPKGKPDQAPLGDVKYTWYGIGFTALFKYH